MKRTFRFCLILTIGSFCICRQAPAQPATASTGAMLDAQKLKQHVFTLASADFAGRRGAQAERSVAYIEAAFRKAGLKPAFKETYLQDVVQGTSGRVIGRNVAGMVEGSDPALKQEWIILSAHWDHLGQTAPKADVKPKVFTGADDNASGVAMLLESAAWFSRPENRPRRSILFVAFDLEEFGLFGSRYFAAHMPMSEKDVKLFVTADMIGRSLSGICRDWVFVMGSERLPESRQWLQSASQGKTVKAGLLGTDLVGVRSDYGPFMTRKIPFLFFSTGECREYHTVEDRPETLDYAKLHQVSEMICQTVKTAADGPSIGSWSETPASTPEEMKVLAAVLEEMKSPASGLKLGGYHLNLIEKTLGQIRQILSRNVVSEADRKSVIRAAQILMFTAL